MIPIERRVSDDTRLIDLTVGELKELFGIVSKGVPGGFLGLMGAKKRYVYGIKGIKELFHCSDASARRFKSGVIKKAVSQHGRTIVIDVDLALKLFNESCK